MNKVTLYKLADIDLAVRYARKLPTGELVHYEVGFADIANGIASLALIQEHIEREEGTTEFEILDQPEVGMLVEKVDILESCPAVEKALRKVTVKTPVMQREVTERLSPGAVLKNLAAAVLNPPILAINLWVLTPLQTRKLGVLDLPGPNEEGYDYWQYEANKIRKRQMRLFQPIQVVVPEVTRSLNPATFLSYQYSTEAGMIEAQARMREALVRARPYILGNLCMPSKIQLTDTVGFQSPEVIFCFFFMDREKLRAKLGIDPKVASSTSQDEDVQFLGAGACPEGSIGPNCDYGANNPPSPIRTIHILPDRLAAQRAVLVDQHERSMPLGYTVEAAHARRVKNVVARREKEAEAASHAKVEEATFTAKSSRLYTFNSGVEVPKKKKKKKKAKSDKLAKKDKKKKKKR